MDKSSRRGGMVYTSDSKSDGPCAHEGSTPSDGIKLSSSRYVPPGTYLYAFVVVVDKEHDFIPSGEPLELPPVETMKRILLESTEE
jgi:hypothetical protein